MRLGFRVVARVRLVRHLIAGTVRARGVLVAILGQARLRRHHLGARRHCAGLVRRFDGGVANMVAAAPGWAAALGAARAIVGLGVGGALRALLLVDQRLPVGNRDLIVVGMDFAEGE